MAPDDGQVTGYRILRRRPILGEDVLLEYVANTQSTAATFTDTDVTRECSTCTGFRRSVRRAGANARTTSTWTRRTGDGSRQRERPHTCAGGPFETQKGFIKVCPFEEALSYAVQPR